METYSLLREFADSWMLLALTVFFVAVVVWVFRPGARSAHHEAATVIFRNDRRPGDTGVAASGSKPSIKPGVKPHIKKEA